MNPHDHITDHFRLIEPQKQALKRLGLSTIRDLIYHFPVRYGDTSETRSIAHLGKGDEAVVFGKISGLKTSKGFRSKIPMADGYVEDESGKIHCVWFNQPYLAKMVTDGALVRVEGKISQRKVKTRPDGSATANSGELYFSNPKIEVVHKLPQGVGENLFKNTSESDSITAHTMYPIYPESRGITSNWIYHAIAKIFRSGALDAMIDPIPDDILARYSLPPLRTAAIWVHTPMNEENAEVARKRFSFEEIFFIQLEKQRARKEYEQNPAFVIGETKFDRDGNPLPNKTESDVQAFVKRFPFEATEAQQKAIGAVLDDFKRGHAMSRLLEGDVGSGKTAVAAASAFAVVNTRPPRPDGSGPASAGSLQVAYMCPTEILATQHFESFIQYFSYLGVQIGLITGSGCRKFPSKLNPKGWTDISRSQLLTWVENGEIPILIGTHALIQKSVKFKNLAYVIIDEQHRFGTKQRAELVRKERAEHKGKTIGGVPAQFKTKTPLPHLLSMTATPIPRTLALTVYGDLDLTLLDQMPHGRKPIITEVVMPHTREATYEKIRTELSNGRQAYVICPRIDEPDPTKEAAVNAKSVKEEAKRLKEKVFPEYEIGILHSKMKPAEKDKIMLDFKAGKVHILCATSVVEVGVNVPNATVIIIEGGERFGLAQLHQLRGRVMRSSHQAYCYIFTSNTTASEKTAERLKALTTAKNGFELAEFDLMQRGAGALAGGKQWGVSDMAMEALKNIKMVEAARAEARAIIDANDNGTLTTHPDLHAHLEHRKKRAIHLE